MSITRHECNTGPLGYQVVCCVGGQRRQAWFSPCNAQMPKAWRHARLQAELQQARWEAEQAWLMYQQRVTQPHKRTAAARALPLHGITLNFRSQRNGEWIACFVVQAEVSGSPSRNFHFLSQSYTDAWRTAVDHWAQRRDVAEEDYQRIRQSPPEPERFKELRRWLCDNGHDIPVDALRPVFAERRDQIRRKRQQELAARARQTGASVSPHPDTLTEMQRWFESELQSSQ